MSGVNCREYEMTLMDLARRRPVDEAAREALAAHVESCARCRHLFDLQIRLSAAAGVVADDASRWNAPFHVEQAVMAEARALRVPRQRRVAYGLVGAVVAASLVLVWAVNRTAVPKTDVAKVAPAPVVTVAPPLREMAKVVPAKQVVRKASQHRPSATAAPEQPFIEIPYTMPLQPYEHAAVVRMDVPVTALIAVGLPVEGADPGARVQTDVLLGQDGQARAVRLISISMMSYQGVSQQ